MGLHEEDEALTAGCLAHLAAGRHCKPALAHMHPQSAGGVMASPMAAGLRR